MACSSVAGQTTPHVAAAVYVFGSSPHRASRCGVACDATALDSPATSGRLAPASDRLTARVESFSESGRAVASSREQSSTEYTSPARPGPALLGRLRRSDPGGTSGPSPCPGGGSPRSPRVSVKRAPDAHAPAARRTIDAGYVNGVPRAACPFLHRRRGPNA